MIRTVIIDNSRTQQHCIALKDWYASSMHNVIEILAYDLPYRFRRSIELMRLQHKPPLGRIRGRRMAGGVFVHSAQ